MLLLLGFMCLVRVLAAMPSLLGYRGWFQLVSWLRLGEGGNGGEEEDDDDGRACGGVLSRPLAAGETGGSWPRVSVARGESMWFGDTSRQRWQRW